MHTRIYTRDQRITRAAANLFQNLTGQAWSEASHQDRARYHGLASSMITTYEIGSPSGRDVSTTPVLPKSSFRA